jgi:formylglycine-generating enzyme required for sulfatase activity
MSGKVMDWVSDWWSTTFYDTPEASVDPTGPNGGTIKVEKGGWFGNVPYVGRTAYRHFEDSPTYQHRHIGVRIVTP